MELKPIKLEKLIDIQFTQYVLEDKKEIIATSEGKIIARFGFERENYMTPPAQIKRVVGSIQSINNSPYLDHISHPPKIKEYLIVSTKHGFVPSIYKPSIKSINEEFYFYKK